MERIALIGQTYTGKTTLALALKARGYLLVNFTDVLKQELITALAVVGKRVTMAELKQDKHKYRKLLQEFGVVIGFDDDPRYVEEALVGWHVLFPDTPVVFDNVRTIEQWSVLKRYGFTLVETVADEKTRLQRALAAGADGSGLQEVDTHPVETVGRLKLHKIAHVIDTSTGTPDEIAASLQTTVLTK